MYLYYINYMERHLLFLAVADLSPPLSREEQSTPEPSNPEATMHASKPFPGDRIT